MTTGKKLSAKTTDVDHVVILVHGIRTYARWQIPVERILEKAGLEVVPANFGRFGLLSFLLPVPWLRQQQVARVWTIVREARKLYPRAKISFLAHSFGSFVVAEILRQNFDFKAHRIIFCGSVVRYNFPFEQIAERFTPPLINDVGTRDPWPAIAESVTWGYGSAGTYGFRHPRVQDRWHNGLGHSAFLKAAFCRAWWLPYLAEGKIRPGDPEPEPAPWWIGIISSLRLRYMLVTTLLAVSLFWMYPESMKSPTILTVVDEKGRQVASGQGDLCPLRMELLGENALSIEIQSLLFDKIEKTGFREGNHVAIFNSIDQEKYTTGPIYRLARAIHRESRVVRRDHCVVALGRRGRIELGLPDDLEIGDPYSRTRRGHNIQVVLSTNWAPSPSSGFTDWIGRWLTSSRGSSSENR